ncbi:5' nucleotidase, NT5C type [Tepidibacter mesophilus]|uniref:5' nucleotidase, NT5C type n=1 Tax=Tepidibacter mesophilus TaxID=655607 RepID=UPI000C08C2F0|nr:hypothetical protein [Tepidibacter mesophilus]
MKNLNICIDIDGTITDAYYWIHLANKYFNKNIKEEDVISYEMHEVFNVEKEKYMEFYNANIKEIHEAATLKEGVKPILDKLIKTNNLYFVTARDKRVENITINFFKENNIPHNNLFLLGKHYKVDKAIALSCDIFIEDNYSNAIQLSTAGFNVILIDTYYNRKKLNDKITRVKTWDEIYNIIVNKQFEKVS